MSEIQKDSVLNSFIELVREDKALKAEIKAALNQEQVIAIAASRGYEFDSLTISNSEEIEAVAIALSKASSFISSFA